LEKAGIAIVEGRVRAQATQQCGAAHLFAAGDVCGPHEIVHIAIQQGEIAARNAARVLGKLDGALETIDYRLKLLAIFTHPQLATAGLGERECAEQGIAIDTAKYPFADHGKSLVRGEPDGFVKLIVERASRRILGAACVGPEASELIHEIVVAMHFRATAGDLAHVPHYHPTLSEIWTYPAEELA
jgi:pyruvate/2-oxoglutarate dehydrogenase complex dihydrolipoamide dehydrogenase (E3) component